MRISDWSSDVCSSDLAEMIPPADTHSQSAEISPLRRAFHCRNNGRYPPNSESTWQSQEFPTRSNESRVGKACVRTSRSRWSQYHKNKHTHKNIMSSSIY